MTIAIGSDGLIFAGRDMTLLSHRPFKSPTIHVTFSHRCRDYSVREGFGAGFFSDRGLDAIHCVAHWSHWWQTDEVRLCYEQVLKAILKQYSNVVLYGVSMGGAGALAYSSIIGADRVICISPIFTVRPELATYDNRWTEDLARVDFVHDELAGVSRTAQITILYDPFEPRDAGHVTLLKSLRSVDEVRLPFAGHGGTGFLKEIGSLASTVSGLIDGSLDKNGLVRRIRDGKRKSFRYWMFIIDRLVTRGSVELVRKATAHFDWMLENESDPLLKRYFIRKSTPFISRAHAFLGDRPRLIRFSKEAVRLRALNFANAAAFSEAFFNLSDHANALKFGLICQSLAKGQADNLQVVKTSYRTLRARFDEDEEFYSYLASLGLLRAHFQPVYDTVLQDDGDRAERDRLWRFAADHVQQRVARGLSA